MQIIINTIKRFKEEKHDGFFRLVMVSLMVVLLTVPMASVVYGLNSGSQWVDGSWMRMDAHNVCYHMYVSDGVTRFVPGGTAAAWSNFRSYAPNVGYDNCLYYRYRDGQCTGAGSGGVVVWAGGYRICRFTLSYCPSGWSNFNSWTITSANTCQDTGNACTTGSHGWSNNSTVEVCYYRGPYICTQYGTGKNSGDCISGYWSWPACYATVAYRGCY